jgi:hypothetical protein
MLAREVAAEGHDHGDLERIAAPFAIDALGEFAGAGDEQPGFRARQRLDDACRRELDESRRDDEVRGRAPGPGQQAVGAQVVEQCAPVDGVDAEILPQERAADACAARGEAGDTGRDAAGGRA